MAVGGGRLSTNSIRGSPFYARQSCNLANHPHATLVAGQRHQRLRHEDGGHRQDSQSDNRHDRRLTPPCNYDSGRRGSVRSCTGATDVPCPRTPGRWDMSRPDTAPLASGPPGLLELLGTGGREHPVMAALRVELHAGGGQLSAHDIASRDSKDPGFAIGDPIDGRSISRADSDSRMGCCTNSRTWPSGDFDRAHIRRITAGQKWWAVEDSNL